MRESFTLPFRAKGSHRLCLLVWTVMWTLGVLRSSGLIHRWMNKTAHWVPAILRETSVGTSYCRTIRLAPKNSSSPQYSNLTSDLPVKIELYLSVNKPFQRALVNGIDRRVAHVFKRMDTCRLNPNTWSASSFDLLRWSFFTFISFC